MSVEVKVPTVGESITEVQIGQWRKSEGDEVKADEILVTLETDKASVDLPAPVAGLLKEVLRKKGETAEVGEVIAYMERSAASPAKRKATGKGTDGKGDVAGPELEEGERDEEAEREGERRDEGGGNKEERDEASDPVEADRKGAGDRGDEKTEDKRADRGTPAETSAHRVSPVAKAMLEQHGLSIEDFQSRGDRGRILKQDVLRELSERGVEREADGSESERREESVPMSPIRRRIAQRLVRASREAALLTTFNDVDMSAVVRLRKKFGERFRESYDVKLGFMSFFVKAVIDALKKLPGLNAEIRGDDIVYKNHYDIGIAVGGGKGLVVPVLRDADRMSFAQIERAIADFARSARENTLKLEELEGGTFTISNGGVYGSLLSTPIVNPPQSGILGLHRIDERPVARDGQVVIRPMMYVALTYDHRIVDGREAVTFLARIKDAIEDPSRLILEV